MTHQKSGPGNLVPPKTVTVDESLDDGAIEMAWVITKVVHMVQSQCADVGPGTVLQALLLLAAHFAKQNEVPQSKVVEYLNLNFDGSTASVLEAVTVITSASRKVTKTEDADGKG